jgi:hypothetical protein
MFSRPFLKGLVLLCLILNFAIPSSVSVLATENKQISVILEKITPVGGNKYEALFGYLNYDTNIAFVPIGADNYFTPEVSKVGINGELNKQSEEFKVGRQYGTFKINMECGKILVWTLKAPDGKTRTATAGTPACPVLVDEKAPIASVKFLENPISVADNKPVINSEGCYFVSKYFADGKGGKLAVIADYTKPGEKETMVSENYNLIPDLTYLGYYKANDNLIFKIYPFFDKSPKEVLSTQPERMKIDKLGEDSFRFSFEDWNDNDFNDLVIIVSKSVCPEGVVEVGNGKGEAVEIPDKSIVFTKNDSVGVVHFAKDPVNENGTKNGIVGGKFLDGSDKSIAVTYPKVDKCNNQNCALENKKPALDSSFYAWNGNNLWLTQNLPTDGIYTRKVQAVDKFGNLTTAQNSVVKDTTPPQISDLNLKSVAASDLAGKTSSLKNNLSFNLNDVGFSQAISANLPLEPTQSLKYRVSFDNQNFGDWQAAIVGQNSVEIDFPNGLSSELLGKDLKVYLQTKDVIENVSSWESSIKFEVAKPIGRISINNGQKLSAESDLPIKIEVQSVAEITKAIIAKNLEDLAKTDYSSIELPVKDQQNWQSLEEKYDFKNDFVCSAINNNEQVINNSSINNSSLTINNSNV